MKKWTLQIIVHGNTEKGLMMKEETYLKVAVREQIIIRLTTELYQKRPEEMTLSEWNDLLERITSISQVEKS